MQAIAALIGIGSLARAHDRRLRQGAQISQPIRNALRLRTQISYRLSKVAWLSIGNPVSIRLETIFIFIGSFIHRIASVMTGIYL